MRTHSYRADQIHVHRVTSRVSGSCVAMSASGLTGHCLHLHLQQVRSREECTASHIDNPHSWNIASYLHTTLCSLFLRRSIPGFLINYEHWIVLRLIWRYVSPLLVLFELKNQQLISTQNKFSLSIDTSWTKETHQFCEIERSCCACYRHSMKSRGIQ